MSIPIASKTRPKRVVLKSGYMVGTILDDSTSRGKPVWIVVDPKEYNKETGWYVDEDAMVTLKRLLDNSYAWARPESIGKGMFHEIVS